MTATITWVHVRDRQADAADGRQGIERLERIVADVIAMPAGVDFVYPPVDDANHATAEQYRRIMAALAALDACRAGLPGTMRPFDRMIAGHRCLFLDVVGAGSGGLHFRLRAGERHRLEAALADSDDADVTFVDTGYTRYNELLNDGRVVYGATRSTARIEEEDGMPGYSIVSVHGGMPNRTFRPIGESADRRPHIQILSPADIRLATRTGDMRHIPAPGTTEVAARRLSDDADRHVLLHDGVDIAMDFVTGIATTWRAVVDIATPGVHTLMVRSGGYQTRSTSSSVASARIAPSVPPRSPPVMPRMRSVPGRRAVC